MEKQNEKIILKNKALEEKEEEIGNLKKQLNEVMNLTSSALEQVKTPIQVLTNTISSLIEDDSISKMPNIQNKLRQLMVFVSKQNLYKPTVENFISNKNIDNVTKSYIFSEISGRNLDVNDELELSSLTFPNLSNHSIDPRFESWTFDLFNLSSQEILIHLKQFFVHFDLINRFKIDEKQFEKFLLLVKKNYFENPYHNFIHAFDVTQTIFSMLISMNLVQYLTHVDIFALLISGLCHDLQHPGLNNPHQVTTMSELAIKYNDKSVLENHHCYMTFKLLLDNQILENTPKSEFLELRKIIIACILATDMAAHFEFLSKIESRTQSGKQWNRDDRDDRILLSQLIMKVSDISNVAKSWDCSYKWTEFLSKEFFNQGDLEKSKNLDVAPFMDREKSSMFKNTCNFIDFVASPFFTNVSKSLPSTNQIVDLLKENRVKWGELQTEFENQQKTN